MRPMSPLPRPRPVSWINRYNRSRSTKRPFPVRPGRESGGEREHEREIERLNQRLASRSAAKILRWAWESFGPQVIASSSFQTQSVSLLHLIAQVCPQMPVIFIDTGFHFPETLAFRDQLAADLGLNIQVTRAALDKAQLTARHGEELYRRDPELCCHLHKVEPMQRALEGKRAWVAGVRRDQTAHRQSLRVIERKATGQLKVHPLIHWTQADVQSYIQRYDLPSHPLFDQGYPSVGCVPCTRPTLADEEERAGRWPGLEKVECGLHLGWTNTTP